MLDDKLSSVSKSLKADGYNVAILTDDDSAARSLLLCYDRRGKSIVCGIISERSSNEYNYYFGHLFLFSSHRSIFVGNYRLNELITLTATRLLEDVKHNIRFSFRGEIGKCVYDNPCEAVNKFAAENRYTVLYT